ncbi:MAG: hypothetical protein LiPW41_521 [Parcubacteria group bacterium LiPW_41]|nr:MAG: hypothetical protein LiPW41_521 [Parcubacteria group bacterium LiPW_41]
MFPTNKFMGKFAIKSAVHLFLIKNGNILLLRRANTGYEDGNYIVPAGGLDEDESVTMATAREAREEADIIVDPKNLKMVHVMHRTKDDGGRIDFFFTTDKWEGEPRIAEPHKCDDMNWFPLNALPQNVVPYVKFALEKSNQGITFSEFEWEV